MQKKKTAGERDLPIICNVESTFTRPIKRTKGLEERVERKVRTTGGCVQRSEMCDIPR